MSTGTSAIMRTGMAKSLDIDIEAERVADTSAICTQRAGFTGSVERMFLKLFPYSPRGDGVLVRFLSGKGWNISGDQIGDSFWVE